MNKYSKIYVAEYGELVGSVIIKKSEERKLYMELIKN